MWADACELTTSATQVLVLTGLALSHLSDRQVSDIDTTIGITYRRM